MGKKGKRKSNYNDGFETLVKHDVRSQTGWKKNSSKKKKKNIIQPGKFNPSDVHMTGSDLIVKRPASGGFMSSNGWHRVILHNAGKFSREAVLQPIARSLALKSIPFEPICFQMQGQHYHFYVESPSVAAEIKSLDKQIQLSPANDFTLIIKVAASPSPPMKLDQNSLELLKNVMAQRFNSETNHLNLSNFHRDRAFLEYNGYIPLARASVMSNVIKIISNHVSHVVSIDFSNNKLPALEFFSNLETPQLKFLSLDDNRLDLNQLQKLKHLKLHSLSILNNTSIRCSDLNEDVRKKTIEKIMSALPTLKVLNGEPLPKNLKFGVEEDVDEFQFPIRQQSLITNDFEVNSLVQKFIQTYFSIYDSDDKEPLLRAYDDNATFSFCSVFPPGTSASNAGQLREYMTDSRNLKLVLKKEKRDRLLKQGRISIVAMLSNLPKTTHILHSFTLDILPLSQSLLSITVTGLFHERSSLTPNASSRNMARYFNRTFILVRVGSAFIVINDIMFVTLPTKEQQKALESTPQATGGTVSEADLVRNLSQASRMNSEWSTKCLLESNWDYNRALEAFQEAYRQSLVPAEAFQV